MSAWFSGVFVSCMGNTRTVGSLTEHARLVVQLSDVASTIALKSWTWILREVLQACNLERVSVDAPTGEGTESWHISAALTHADSITVLDTLAGAAPLGVTVETAVEDAVLVDYLGSLPAGIYRI